MKRTLALFVCSSVGLLLGGNVRAQSGSALVFNGANDFAHVLPFAATALLAQAPVVTTVAATGISADSATLNGLVNPNGDATGYYFEYGPTPTHTVTNLLPASESTSSVSIAVGGLAHNTVYHFRVLATNSVGLAAGSNLTFTTLPFAITQQPASGVVCVGNEWFLTVGVNAATATFQWQRRNPGAGAFNNILNATNQWYFVQPVTPADDGAAFRVIASVSANGTNLTSSEALLSVISISAPTVTYDFNNGLPPNTAIYGSTFVSNGVLELNTNTMSQSGAFLMPDLAPGRLVRGFAATFKVKMQGGSVEPGDGFSFNWATDLPNSFYVTGEEGQGSGLRVCFDTYNNGSSEAPAIDVKWGTNVVGHYLTSNAFLPGFANDFAEVTIRLNTDGTIDVSYRCTPIFTRLPVPGYAPQMSARFGFGSRAGAAYESHSIDDFALQLFVDSTNGVPRITRITNQPPTSVVIIGTAAPGGNLALEASTNLAHWSWRAHVTPNGSGVWQFTENTTSIPYRFYRVSGVAQLPTNLVSWWRAEGNYLDSFGGNHGSAFNGFGPAFTNGQRGQAFNFASNNQGIVLAGGAPIPVPWTACFWVKRRDTTNASAALLTDGATGLKLEQAGTPRLVGFTRFGVADYSFNYMAPSNVWTHLTFVGTPAGTILYVNGVPNGTNANTINLPRQLLGARPTGTDFMLGQLDETATFNRALTPAEIQQVINATRGP